MTKKIHFGNLNLPIVNKDVYPHMTYALSDGEYYVQTIKADSTNKVNGTGCMKFNGFEWLIKDVWSGSQFFTSSGTFIVPAGVTSILVTASAGGGGGGTCSHLFTQTSAGDNGGNTAVGTLITLTGGGGGRQSSSTDGSGSSDGSTGTPYTTLPAPYAAYGAGGAGGSVGVGGHGGHGGTCYNTQFYVTPKQVLNITVGAGGRGQDDGGYRGGNGASGFVKIDW